MVKMTDLSQVGFISRAFEPLHRWLGAGHEQQTSLGQKLAGDRRTFEQLAAATQPRQRSLHGTDKFAASCRSSSCRC